VGCDCSRKSEQIRVRQNKVSEVMKYCHLLTSVAIALLSCLVLGAVSVNSDSASFEEFVGRFGRNYASLEEYAQRKAIFSDNIKRIAELNAAHVSADTRDR
jgi:hypothetical protein